MPPKSRAKQPTAARKRKRRDEPVSEDNDCDNSSAEGDVQALDSDNLDDDDADKGKKAGKRRKKVSPIRARRRRKEAGSDGEESDLELKEGQEVVGKIVRAPKTGQGEPQLARREALINSPRRFPASSSRTDLSEHLRLSESAQPAGMQ